MQWWPKWAGPKWLGRNDALHHGLDQKKKAQFSGLLMKLAQHLMLTSATAVSSTKATSSDKKIKIKNKCHVTCHVNSHVSCHVSIHVTWIYNL